MNPEMKAKLGNRYVCFQCGTKFYDLNKDVAACPECGADQADAPVQDYRAMLAATKKKSPKVKEVEEEIESESIRSKASGEEGSRASMLTSHNMLTLREMAPDRTAVMWNADVNITGRLGKYGLGLMRKKAEKLSGEFVAAFAATVEAGTVVR